MSSGTNVNSSILPKVSKTEIIQDEAGYKLLLDGHPFYIKGAGVDNGSIKALASHGANCLRTWSTNNAVEVLDKAHELGLKVMMGIWVGLERHGFDYDDKVAVNNQLESIRKKVLEIKDHPALIVWGVGNELNLQSTNPKVWDALNDISEMIHSLDTNHLVTTSLAGFDEATLELIEERASDIDFVSTQLYGPIDYLPEILEKSSYRGPVLVTEWGATGYWEVDKTKWGAPLENNSTVKADLYLERYQNAILSQSKQVMGSFVFLWGQKQERTPTWFGMFMPDGNETASIDVMHYVWTGQWPKNQSPKLLDFTLNNKIAKDNIELKSGEIYHAEVDVSDPDGDQLRYIWEIMKESESTKTGGDAEYLPESFNDLFQSKEVGKATFTAPSKEGAYRLFVYIKDGHQHTAHANIPFYVVN